MEEKSTDCTKDITESGCLLSSVRNKRSFPTLENSAESKCTEHNLISFEDGPSDKGKIATTIEENSSVTAPSSVPDVNGTSVPPTGTKCVNSALKRKAFIPVTKGRKTNNMRRSPEGCCPVEQISKNFAASCGISPKLPTSTKKYIDSHCHLDFLYNKIGKDQNGLQEWIQNYPDAFPDNFHGCIPNFVHPSLFIPSGKNSDATEIPWIFEQVKHDKVIGASYGVHPHFCAGYDIDTEAGIRKMLANRNESKAIAVGECGYDLFKSDTSVDQQKIAFESQLRLAKEFQLPVIIHCRSAKGSLDAEELCLSSMMPILSRFHHIHRHCFTESYDTAKIWLKNFPNTHFGFTCAIEKSWADKSAVKHLPMRRILLETDAPYFRPRMFQSVEPRHISLPGMAVAVADLIAREREISVDEVIEATYLNTLDVYVLNNEE